MISMVAWATPCILPHSYQFLSAVLEVVYHFLLLETFSSLIIKNATIPGFPPAPLCLFSSFILSYCPHLLNRRAPQLSPHSLLIISFSLFFFLHFFSFEKYALPPIQSLRANNTLLGFSPWPSSKESTCNAGDAEDSGLIPGSGRSPGGGHGNPFQYSCLENPMDRGAWWVTVHRLGHDWSDWACMLTCNTLLTPNLCVCVCVCVCVYVIYSLDLLIFLNDLHRWDFTHWHLIF